MNSLQCPATSVEQPGTAPAYYPRKAGTTPDLFICRKQLDIRILQDYAYAKNPGETRALELKGLSIENALSLSRWMIVNAYLKQGKI